MTDRKLQAALEWQRYSEQSDEAFHAGNTMMSTYFSKAAFIIANTFRVDYGLRTVDRAVAEMRELLKRK